MSIKQDLQYSIKVLLKHTNEGSFATQATRKKMLMTFAKDLVSLGYGLRNIRGLKEKHIIATVQYWQKNNKSVATIKNRTAALRYLCEKINKINIVPSNDGLSIGKRQYKPTKNKAIHDPNFINISDSNTRISLELQRVFGLRREESIKIKPHLADKDTVLELQPSWCKGGRGRFIPIETKEQRYWLEQAKLMAGEFGNSLIPSSKNYIQQLYVYEKQVSRAGLKNPHGLRHAYAQQRYETLAGWKAPINGGSTYKELTLEQKEIDHRVRMIITEELGHSRKQITVNYLGR